ncbi:MAG TPA: hypothetical protein VI776_14015 [Anaerolineales bacterium]|nr:hypothetical protein [Anaerolineales bacterium]
MRANKVRLAKNASQRQLEVSLRGRANEVGGAAARSNLIAWDLPFSTSGGMIAG